MLEWTGLDVGTECVAGGSSSFTGAASLGLARAVKAPPDGAWTSVFPAPHRACGLSLACQNWSSFVENTAPSQRGWVGCRSRQSVGSKHTQGGTCIALCHLVITLVSPARLDSSHSSQANSGSRSCLFFMSLHWWNKNLIINRWPGGCGVLYCKHLVHPTQLYIKKYKKKMSSGEIYTKPKDNSRNKIVFLWSKLKVYIRCSFFSPPKLSKYKKLLQVAHWYSGLQFKVSTNKLKDWSSRFCKFNTVQQVFTCTWSPLLISHLIISYWYSGFASLHLPSMCFV